MIKNVNLKKKKYKQKKENLVEKMKQNYICLCSLSMIGIVLSHRAIASHKIIKEFYKILLFPICLFCSFFQIKILGKVIITQMDLVVTNKCTLKCTNCNHLVPYYQNPQNISKEVIINNLEQLFKIVYRIDRIVILGGEPMLHYDLDEIVTYCLLQRRLKSIVIVTNGTILPKYIDFDNYRDSKITFSISDYGKYSYQKDQLVKECKDRNINYSLEEELIWRDFGSVDNRERSKAELKQVYKKCIVTKFCKSLMDNEFHVCPRSSNGTRMGAVPKKDEDYVDIYNGSIKELRKKFLKLYTVKYIEACNYCDGLSLHSPIITAAIQIDGNNNEKKFD